ncbi:MAG: sigma-70 family RNA polymerase sigma factor [Oscillospiraceae bacterium]|nr:sigma-70 family RNA polymerase sigma factor [Oscillospiraceae bacterium]
MNDIQWIGLLKTNPESAYSEAIEIYGDYVYAIVLNKLKNNSSREDIEDCVSDIFVELFRSADRFDASAGSLKTFIATIAKRRAVDEYRRLIRNNIKSVNIDDDDTFETLCTTETPLNHAERRDEKNFIWHKIRGLGEPDSIILIQQYFYDKTIKEIASMLSMTAAAVQKRSIRARECLKAELTKEGITYQKG